MLTGHREPDGPIPTKDFHIPSLDGLRAVAILIVFFAHSGFGKTIPGGFGVTVFFFISGYLITSLLRREFELNRTVSLRNFYARRILRIWPAFYLVLFLGAVLTLLRVLNGELTFLALLSQSMHVANYYSIYFGQGMTMGSGVYWSLAVEEHFYLVFPLIYIGLSQLKIKPRNQMWLLFALCCAILAWRCILVFGLGSPTYRTYYASDTRFDSLLFGCALAVYGNPALDQPKLSDAWLKVFWLPFGIGLIIVSFFYRNAEFRETFRYSIQGLGLIPIFIAAIRYPHWGPFRVLNWRWVKFVGTLSYSLYLVHYTVIQAIEQYFPQTSIALLPVVSLVVSMAIAYCIYAGVERPFGRLRKQFRVAPTSH